mmetsp:Transcript_50351/g.57771  ORF Transcript_50351/g.57771 Transcript_50351/m.57771 type:complete len:125 (+) Transcript_50351:113-487(+)
MVFCGSTKHREAKLTQPLRTPEIVVQGGKASFQFSTGEWKWNKHPYSHLKLREDMEEAAKSREQKIFDQEIARYQKLVEEAKERTEHLKNELTVIRLKNKVASGKLIEKRFKNAKIYQTISNKL